MGLKFRMQVVEGLYYPYSENKGADQLRGYREADLRLCFRICKKPVFSRRGSNYIYHCITKIVTWNDLNIMGETFYGPSNGFIQTAQQ